MNATIERDTLKLIEAFIAHDQYCGCAYLDEFNPCVNPIDPGIITRASRALDAHFQDQGS